MIDMWLDARRPLEETVWETVLKAGTLRPVDLNRWTMEDLRNAYRNANEHLMLYAVTEKDGVTQEILDALSDTQKVCAKIRRDIWVLLFWRKVPLAKTAVDKYRKAIAKNYVAMVEAGGVLVSAGVPQHAGLKLYRSLCIA
jgi:uncharacterized protein YdaL